MSMMPIFLIVWAVLVACLLALLAYRGTITRYEEDQLFLDGSNTLEQSEQNEIVRKVNKLQPMVRAVGGATGLVTVAIIGMYAWNLWHEFMK